MDTLQIATIVGSIVCYLICGIPFGLIIASIMGGVDVRKEGSGNIGMTNVARSVGGKAAALTFACDVGKGVLCMVLARFVIAQMCFGGDVGMLVHNGPFGWVVTTLFAACVMGHVFSPYLGFHGGKGIAVGLGASLGLYWPLGLGMLALFLLLVIPTHYISLGSIAAAASLPFLGMFFGVSGFALIPMALVAVVVIWSHRENIGRLIRGEEHGFSIKHKGDGK